MSIQTILAASNSLNKMQMMQSSRTQMEGQANILRSQSKQDGGDEKKEAQAQLLDEKSDKLMGDLMGEAIEINESLRAENEDVTSEKDASEEDDKIDRQSYPDTVELSDSATEYIYTENPIKPVVGDAVIYKPDGSTVANNSQKGTPVIKIRV